MNAIEIRAYEGDGADLAALIERSWRKNFTGKMWFPLWDQAFFQWRLLDPRTVAPEFLICAYRGADLVGCLLAEPIRVRVGDRMVGATLSSWLTVDPDVRVPGIGTRLVEGLRQRHLAAEMRISLGVVGADASVPTRRFWDGLARRKPQDVRYLQRIWFWTRVLDGPAVAAAGLTAAERIGPRLSSLIPWGWGVAGRNARVRSYREDDLPRCLAWVHAQGGAADIQMLWTEPRMSVQLGQKTYPTTLVLDAPDGRGAFLNYHVIDWCGNGDVRVAMVDLFAGDASPLQQVGLWRAAGGVMREQGVQLVLMMASQGAPRAVLLGAGFMPFPSSVGLVALFPDPELTLAPPLRFHLPFT